jgi:hypothetical protein
VVPRDDHDAIAERAKRFERGDLGAAAAVVTSPVTSTASTPARKGVREPRHARVRLPILPRCRSEMCAKFAPPVLLPSYLTRLR